MKKLLIMFFCVIGVFSYATQITGDTSFWTMEDFYGFDEVGDKETTLGDISSVFGRIEENNFLLRVSFDDMVLHLDDKRVIDKFAEKKMTLKFVVSAESKELINTSVNLYELSIESKNLSYKRTPQTSMAEVIIPFDGNYSKDDLIVRIKVFNNGTLADEFTSEGRNTRGGNAAFVHHGNQGLTYTEVFYGQFPQDSSGFDEVLEVHQDTGIPGNFHMSGTLMPAAEWHNPEFNDWLVDGVNDGYVAMLSSALGQHIMPFVQNEMNDWSVSVETDMVEYMYGYTPHVAWVPERVWLAPGAYPEAGVEDWLGDNWTQHGINAVILDDWPHGNGADNHKIHWMNNGSGINLRVIPIDNDFVGQMHYDANAAKSTISGTGDWGLAVYGTDWEVAAEMNEHNGTSFLDNYIDVLWYCYNNYPAVNIWKLDDAINHSDFNGWGIDVSNGTYGLLGGSDGYGGSNNSWYTHWASEPSHSDNHTPAWSYGYIWDTVYNNLMAAPDNSLSQLGWYTLMINLHETGWHDSGDISGWEHRYSSHMKNGHVFAEAARWANGDYAETTSCYFIDIDQDGGDELVIHNDKAMYVFEGIGGKANWVFYKDGLGNAYSVVGSDVSYWSETDGDYNENSYNHFAALSDVNPDQQSSVYNMTIDTASGSTVQATLDQWGVTKTITLETGNAYLDISYNFFEETGYVKSGWSPDLLDLIWSGKSHLQRMWGDYGSYCGQRNSASGATIALVLGDGGASHSGEFEGTLLKGDEISGYDVFNMRLYAGYTSDPYDVNYNKVVELDNLASETMDIIGPHVQSDALQVGSNKIQITYNEVVTSETAENTANYLLSGFSGTYNIVSAEYTHYRKVILTLDSDLSAREAGDVIVSNVMDLNDNVIDEDYDTAVLTAIVQPHLVGTINGWDPADHTYDLVLNDSGVWEVTMGLSAGSYEYKVIESDSWDSNDWPGTNQAVTLSALTLLNVKANLGMMPNARGFDEYVTHYNPVIVGSFLSLVGGTDWDPTDLTGEMTDPDGNGIYEWNVLIPVGTYDYKVALNKAWDQDTQGSGGNFSVISDGVMETVFYYDMSINSTSYASVTGSIDSPENVMLAFGVGTINLSWDSVSGANSYKVFSSDNPYTGFDLDTSGAFTDNSWLAPVSQTKKFYYVLASTE
jgi:hypothetical protein